MTSAILNFFYLPLIASAGLVEISGLLFKFSPGEFSLKERKQYRLFLDCDAFRVLQVLRPIVVTCAFRSYCEILVP